ncbi:MAG: M20 family metallopeptidase [Acidimicrobiia bacterium]
MSERSRLHEGIDALVQRHADELVALRHDLHACPELSNREVGTAATAAEHLHRIGLDEVRTGIAGHGVVGLLRGGKSRRRNARIAALRADMDALPVHETSGVPFASTVADVAHACGHDCHTATVLTAATVLAAMRDDLPGDVVFVFQPAEEGPPVDETGGAQAMLDEGAFDGPTPTMVFGMHVGPYPHGHVAYRRGVQFAASALLKVTVEGVGAHASQPWFGVDPMPAAGAIITGLGQLYRQVPAWEAVSVTVGHVEDRGRFNVIGGSVTLWGTIRALTTATMDDLRHRIAGFCRHSAEAYGATADVQFLQSVPPVDNRSVWVDAALPTLAAGAGGFDRVVEAPPTVVYDDVSVFVNAFGGLYLHYGVQDTELSNGRLVARHGGRGLVANHHPAFYADDNALPTSVRIHATMAVDHLLGVVTP